jgi:hypothetical protein
MLTAALLFTLAGVGGATAASFPLRGIPRPPTWLALGHGVAALVSFGVLGYAASGKTLTSLEQLAAALLGLAAVGGLTMFLGFHLRGKPLPLLLVIGHGVLAVAGVALLWFSIYRGG